MLEESWLDLIPGLDNPGVHGVAGVAPQKTGDFAQVSGVVAGVAGVQRHLDATPATPSATPVISEIPCDFNDRHPRHPGHRKTDDPDQALCAWHAGLVKLDALPARTGWTPGAWRQACDDACWLYEGFAGRAVRDGWSAADLFGILPSRPGWGGLADRLRGARNLKMDADAAAWSRHGIRDRFARTGGDALHTSGLVLIWATTQ